MAIQSPVTLDEMKDHLRVVTNDEDDYITGLCLAATDYVEKFQDRTFITRVRTMVLDSFPTIIRPPGAPLISVTSIVYVDLDGVSQTLASTDYRVDAITEPGRITVGYELSWPDTRDITNAITITYIAGYGNAAAVPDSTKAAIKLLVAHLYEHREAVSEVNLLEVPMAVKSLLWIDRIM